jgi:hypothetical protein
LGEKSAGTKDQAMEKLKNISEKIIKENPNTEQAKNAQKFLNEGIDGLNIEVPKTPEAIKKDIENIASQFKPATEPKVPAVIEKPVVFEKPPVPTPIETPVPKGQTAIESMVEKPKQPTEGAYKPKLVKQPYKGGTFVAGEYKGKPYTSDSFMLEFDSKLEAPKNAINIKTGKDAPTEEGINQIVARSNGAEKVTLDNAKKLGKDEYVELTNDKTNVHVQRKYYDYFHKKYPNADFEAVSDTTPILVKQNGELKGLVMPLGKDFMERGAKPEITFKKAMAEPTAAVEKPVEVVEKPKIKEKKAKRLPSGEASVGTRKLGDLEPMKGEKGEFGEFKLHEEVSKLADKYIKGTLGEDYLPRGAAGVHYPTGNVRVSGMNDLAVAAHEFAHALDHQNKIIDEILNRGEGISKIRRDLTKIYTERYSYRAKKTNPLNKRMREGYAMLVQDYILMPKTITGQYPDLVKAFLKEGGAYYKPIIGDFIKDSQRILEIYQGLPALDKIGARVTSELQDVDKESFLSFGEKFKTEIADFLYPLEKVNKDVSNWARAYQNVSTVVMNNLTSKTKGYWGFRDGEFKKILDHNWRNLIDEVGKEDQQAFGYYLVARDQYFQYKELEKIEDASSAEYKNLKSVLDRNGMTEQEVTDAYMENKDRWDKQTKMFDGLQREDLNFMHDKEVQLIDAEKFNALKSVEGYASLKRDFYDELVSDLPDMPKSLGVGKTKVSFLMKRRGSSKTIINPMASGLRNHIEATRKGMKQIVYNKIGDVGIEGMFPKLFQKLELKAIPDPATGAIHFPQEKDPDIIMARRNYKRTPILVDKLIKRTVDDLFTVQNTGIMERILMTTSRIFTKGTTGIISPFFLKNIVIDQFSAAAQTQTGYAPLVTQIKQFTKALQDGADSPIKKYAMEYMVLAGDRQTRAGMWGATPNEMFDMLRGEKNGLRKVTDLLEKGIDISTIPTKMSEIFTRLSEYIKSRQNGEDAVTALEKAGRISAPFHHRGRFGGSPTLSAWVRALPYFNASIEVLTQAAETLGRDPASRQRYAFVWSIVIGAMISGQALVMSKGTDEQKELYEGLYGNDLSRNIYYPKANGKTLGKIPVPQEMGFLAALINMASHDMMGSKNNYKVGDYVQAGTSFLPQQVNITQPLNAFISWIPQAMSPGIQAAFGVRTYPKILPLESQALQRLPPGERSNAQTSKLSKIVGKEFNISPIKMDFLLTGYLGRAAGLVTGKASAYDFTSAFHQENYFTSSRLVQNYYDAKTENDQQKVQMKKDPKAYTVGERMKINKLSGRLESIDSLLSDYRDLDVEKKPEQAQVLRHKILAKINDAKL